MDHPSRGHAFLLVAAQTFAGEINAHLNHYNSIVWGISFQSTAYPVTDLEATVAQFSKRDLWLSQALEMNIGDGSTFNTSQQPWTPDPAFVSLLGGVHKPDSAASSDMNEPSLAFLLGARSVSAYELLRFFGPGVADCLSYSP